MLYTFKRATDDARSAIAEEMRVRGTREVFLLFSLGSQFDHLIKQQLEQLGVFCLVSDPGTVTVDDVRAVSPVGIILSGGPASVHAERPVFDGQIFDLGIPIFAICLGFQMWAAHVGARVTGADKREFATHIADVLGSTPLFTGIPKRIKVLESHGDRIEPATMLTITASTEHAPVAAAEYRHLYGVQFHPEVTETEYGSRIFENFCFRICGAKNRFPAHDIAQGKIEALRKQVGDRRVLLALSGGSDSATVAYLLKHTKEGMPRGMRGIYIKGIDRPEDETYVREYFGKEDWLELKIVDATDQFLAAFAGLTSMVDKRRAMRGMYERILQREIEAYQADFIAQGTLFTDISESGGGYATGARKATIKEHHNIDVQFTVAKLEPLSDCVKDGGRNIGRSIGVPEELLTRHPFPGPGLVVRIEGEVTREALATASACDAIYIEELRRWNLYQTVWQAGATVTHSEHTYTKGDDAGKGHVIALWAVWSVNGFTARAAELPWNFIQHVSRRIGNEVRDCGAVVYRTTDKPPSTIEWG